MSKAEQEYEDYLRKMFLKDRCEHPITATYIDELKQQKAELVEFVNKVEQFLGPYTNSGISRGDLYNLSELLKNKYKLQKGN